MRVALLLAVLLCSAAASTADETRIVFSFGAAKVKKTQGQGMGGLELVFPALRWDLRPVAGWHQSSAGDRYLYAGALREWRLGERWVGGFGLAAGAYHFAGGDDLGGPLEFQSRLALERRWPSGLRTGLAFMHISNSNLYRFNPGSERLLLSFSFPID